MVEKQEIIEQLRRMGLGEIMAEKVAVFFTYEKVLTILDQNPYDLIKVEGIAFPRADKVAQNYFSVTLDDPRRQRALIWGLLDQQKNFGHTFLPQVKLEKEMKKMGVEEVSFLAEAVNAGVLVLDDNRVYTAQMHQAEKGAALLVKERIKQNVR